MMTFLQVLVAIASVLVSASRLSGTSKEKRDDLYFHWDALDVAEYQAAEAVEKPSCLPPVDPAVDQISERELEVLARFADAGPMIDLEQEAGEEDAAGEEKEDAELLRRKRQRKVVGVSKSQSEASSDGESSTTAEITADDDDENLGSKFELQKELEMRRDADVQNARRHKNDGYVKNAKRPAGENELERKIREIRERKQQLALRNDRYVRPAEQKERPKDSDWIRQQE